MRKLGPALGLLVLSACGGGSGGDGGGGGTHVGNLEEFYDAYLDELCEQALHCEAKSALYAFTEILACHPEGFSGILDDAMAQIQASIDAGRIRWNEDEANACLDAIRGVRACTSDLAEAIERGCAHLIEGTVPTGGGCVEDIECQAGNRCLLETECPGVCTALAAAGADCLDDDECRSGLRCGTAGTCEAYSVADGECRDASECPSGTCSNGMCAPILREGEACEPGVFGSTCDGDLVCVGGSDVDPGSCGIGGAVDDACGQYDPCRAGLRCANDVCVTLVGPGRSCESALNCPVGFSCSGACEPLPVAGQACSATEPCMEGVCDGGVCRLLAAGETCEGADLEILSLRECAGFCGPDDGSGIRTCEPLVGQGGPCDSDVQCGDGLECVNDPDTFEGSCLEACGW